MNYRFLVCVKYNGSGYSGWQKQSDNGFSVQNKIEESLSKIANHKVNIFCSSRTDAGVHSIGQTFHFDTFRKRTINEWLFGTNSILPKDISFKWVKNVSINFHARFNAIARRYIYIICNSKLRCSFLNKLVTYYPIYLNVEDMLKGSKFLLGEHDFSFFRSSKCQSKSAFRNIIDIKIFRKGVYIFFVIKADSFLYRMVRNIIGSLLLVGIKKYSFYWIKYLLLLKNRINCHISTVKPDGLYLSNVYY